MTNPSVSNLFPAIAQSFAVIIIGYIFGLSKIIRVNETKSIGILVGKLALPALLFKNLATLDLTAISWPFLGGMLLSKFSVFVGVALITVIISRPFNIGRAGIFGIFATQSNDFALGLPIVKAIYGSDVPRSDEFNYVSYIYLIAPVSLAIVNPIGFTFMEFQRQLAKKSLARAQIPSILLRTMKGVVLNPVIFMTVIGLIVNVILTFGLHREDSDKLPSWLIGFLDIVGGAYAACALFYIGIFMVGKLRNVTLTILLISMLLILAKTILLPIISYHVMYTVMPYGAFNSTRQDIAAFSFVLGTFPTSPTVFIFASQYNISIELIAASLVLCTFLSAPIMYVVARMTLITYASAGEYQNIIYKSQKDISIISSICLMCVFILFMLARRYRSYLHIFVLHLMAAMLMEIIGIDILHVVSDRQLLYWDLFWFSIFFTGVLATRIWMVSLGIGLLVLLRNGPSVAEKAWLPLMLVSWGVPVTITILLVSICATDQHRLRRGLVDVSFSFGEAQLVVSLVVLVLCFLVTSVCVFLIIMMIRKMHRTARDNNGSDIKPEIFSKQFESATNPLLKRWRKPRSVGRRMPTNIGPRTPLNSRHQIVEAMFLNNSAEKRLSTEGSLDSRREITLVSSRQNDSSSAENKEDIHNGEMTPLLKSMEKKAISHDPSVADFHFGTFDGDTGLWSRDESGKNLIRFVIILLFLVFSSLVGILIVFWKIVSPAINGIFIAVNILDTITNFGQGFFLFIVFGFEKHWFWTAMYCKFRSLFFKIETVILPPEEDLDISVVTLCSVFRSKHLQHCKEDIQCDRRFYLRTYQSVFKGSELVDWLLKRGIITNREDGVQYGHFLMLGRVLEHFQEEHYFHDLPYFYHFTNAVESHKAQE